MKASKRRSESASSGSGRARGAVALLLATFLGLASSFALAQGNVTHVATGGSHSCAIVAGGRVKCWGANAYGQLGDGTTVSRTTPVGVVGLATPVAAIALGENHSCALSTTGGITCWGSNYQGQLGDGTTVNRSIPVAVAGLSSGVTAIATGRLHTCALSGYQRMLCWGNNSSGQLGDGTFTSRSSPGAVSGLQPDITLIAAGDANSAAVTTGGVKYWGRDGVTWTQGECLPPIPTPYPPPTWGPPPPPLPPYCPLIGTPAFSKEPRDAPSIPGGVPALSISAGAAANYTRQYNLCAIAPGGRMLCWGGSANTQGAPAGTWMPADVTAVSMGGDHLCVLTSGGIAQCWGDNTLGQLGDGTYDERPRSTPAPCVGLPPGLAEIAAGGAHTCALTATGEAMCWGANYAGQLGDGTKINRPIPVTASGLSGAVANPTTVFEFYHPSLDHYFITWLPSEIAILDSGMPGNGWIRTGYAFNAYTSAQADTSPVCRYYIPPGLGDSHFFGRGMTECNATGQKNPSFVLEDPAFMHMHLPAAGTCPANTTPVYRVFSNRPDANHRYMIDVALRVPMVKNGWLAEGDGPDLVVMCAPQ